MAGSPASFRAEAFPAGLRVLVVDDDPTWLKILEKMLRKCSYEVTTCGLARVALDMLREKRDRFDIVISDVNMPDMDGFKLLEHVGLEMDLPVIMMSVDGETSRVMKGVQHGACDYLLKPIRMKELKNIWQHVLRKKIHEVKEVDSHDGIDDFQLMRNRSNELDEILLFSGSDINFSKKRKDLTNNELTEQDFLDASAVKKARVVWSVDLHQKFVNAVNQIGFDKVGPKKILDLMNVPGLTRENVASHLQKYRLYLSRLQKENEGVVSGGAMNPNSVSNDCAGNFCFHSSTTSLQNSSGIHIYPNEKLYPSSLTADSNDHSNNTATKEEEIKNTKVNVASESPKIKQLPRLSATNSFPESMEQKSQEHAISSLNHWNRGPGVQVQHHAQQQDLFSLVSGFPCKQKIEDKEYGGAVLSTNSSVSPRWEIIGSSESTHMETVGNHVKNIPTLLCKTNSFTNQNEAGGRGFYKISSTRSRYPDQYLVDLIESSSPTSNLTEEPTASSPENALCTFEDHWYFQAANIGSFEAVQYANFTPTNLSGNLDECLKFDCEYALDLMEYPTADSNHFTSYLLESNLSSIK